MMMQLTSTARLEDRLGAARILVATSLTALALLLAVSAYAGSPAVAAYAQTDGVVVYQSGTAASPDW